MSHDSLHILRQLRRRLARLALLGERFFAAVERGDFPTVFSIVAESRRLRAALAGAAFDGRELTVDNTPHNQKLLSEIRTLHASVDLFNQALQAWLARDLPDDKQLLETELGAAALADKMLPFDWDYALDLVVLIGAGLGMVGRALLTSRQQRLIAYVPEGEDHDYPEDIPVVRSHAELSKLLQDMVVEPPNKMTSRRHPDSSLHDEDAAELAEVIHKALADLNVRRTTINEFAGQWIQQSLTNLPDIASLPSIAMLKDEFRGKPMIIVAPGPSLSKNIEALRAAKGKAVIVTMTHALGALQKAGIEPDLTMVVDAQDVSYHFDDIDPRFVGALTTGASAVPKLFDVPAPRNLTFAANPLLEDWVFHAVGESAFVTCGGSVSTSAMGLAAAWGCSPIITCGLDLSFPGGKHYAEGAHDSETVVELGEDGHLDTTNISDGWNELRNGEPVPRFKAYMLAGYHGGEVPTNLNFFMYHRWFEWIARHNELSDRVLINATEGGAKIEGFEQMPLADAIATHCKEPLDFNAAYDDGRSRVDFDERRRHMLEHVEYLRRTVRHCQRQARLCQLIADKARLEEAHKFHYRARLERAEARLQNLMARVGFVSQLRQQPISLALKRARDAQSVDDNIAAVGMLLDEVIGATNELLPILDRSAARIEAALGAAANDAADSATADHDAADSATADNDAADDATATAARPPAAA